MSAIECLGQRIRLIWDSNKVNMVLHKAICQNKKVVFYAILSNPYKILSPVILAKKYVLPIIPPLCNMMRQSNRNDSGNPRHINFPPSAIIDAKGREI